MTLALITSLCLLATPDDADRRFSRALSLHEVGDYDGALAEFLAVYQLRPRPKVLFNIGLEQSLLGRPVDAVATFERLLDAPGTLDAARVTRARELLAEERAQVGQLVLRSDTAAADVVIELDGVTQPDARFGVALPSKAGRRLVSVLAPNALPLRLIVDVIAGQTREVPLTLIRSPIKPARVTVKCEVPGTALSVDGEVVGTAPLTTPLSLTPGRHTLTAHREGYQTSEHSIEVAEGESVTLGLTPTVDGSAPPGILELDSRGVSLTATIDGTPIGLVTGPLKLPPGPHLLTLERAGVFPVTRQVTVDPHLPTTMRVLLELTPSGRGELEAVAAQHTFWSRTLMGTGAAFFVAGLVATIVAVLDLNTSVPALQRALDASNEAEARRLGSHVTAMEWWRSGGVTALVVGLTLAGVGLWAHVSAPDLSIWNTQPTQELGFELGLSGAGLLARGRF